MKHFILPALLIASAAAAIAQDDNAPAASPTPAATSGTTPWSVVGKWNGVECDNQWTDVVSINDDGTFSRTWGDKGTWTLSTMKDHVILILAWETWPAEVVTMIDPATFSGKTLDMHRAVDAATATGTAAQTGTASSFFGTTTAPAK